MGRGSQVSGAAKTETTASTRWTSSLGDTIFAALARLSGILVLVILGAIIVALAIGGAQALRTFGPGFLTSDDWDPVQESFGALVPIFGTIMTAILALLLAVPLAFGIAFYLTELAPAWLRRPVGTAIELLAAVPSIIYGMWGFFVLGPFLANHFQPIIIDIFENVPVLGTIFAGPPSYLSLFNAALILAIMVLPFITAISVDVFKTVPPVLKEAAYGIGCTTWEVVRNVVIPYTRVGVIGGIMLALGRALGETMAVTMVIGNRPEIAKSLFAPGYTMASVLANEFTEATGDLYLSALIEIGLALFFVTIVVNGLARLMVWSVTRGQPARSIA